MMNLTQTKLIGLTMELELKARNFKKLCDELEVLEQNKIDPNDEKLIVIKELFQKNHDEIVEINRQIKEIKETEELKEKQKLEQNNSDNIFKNNDNIKQKENIEISTVETRKSFFIRCIEKIKKIFSK